MKLKVKSTSRFRKDLKRLEKQGMPLEELKAVVATLAEQKPLDPKFRDHSLFGKYKGMRECHIQPDWLLIYSADEETLTLTAVRTGSHALLFGE